MRFVFFTQHRDQGGTKTQAIAQPGRAAPRSRKPQARWLPPKPLGRCLPAGPEQGARPRRCLRAGGAPVRPGPGTASPGPGAAQPGRSRRGRGLLLPGKPPASSGKGVLCTPLLNLKGLSRSQPLFPGHGRLCWCCARLSVLSVYSPLPNYKLTPQK